MRKATRFGAPLIALALLLGACGGGDAEVQEDPKGALEEALDNLGDYEGVRLTVSMGADTEDLVAASEGDLTEEDAQKILDSSLVISSKEGESADDAQFEMVANVAGHDRAVELKGIGKTIYARADVEALVEEFGGDTSEIDAARRQFGSQPGFEFVGPAIDGEWISVEGLEDVIQQFTGQSIPETPSEEDQELVKGFADALKQNVSAEAGDREGPGGHVVATVPLRSTYEEFSKLASQLGQVPTGAGLPPASEVPDENIELDIWIDGGHIKQVEFDFVKLARSLGEDADIPEDVDRLAVRLGIEEFTDDVEAPDDATSIDLQQLMQGFLGGMGGMEESVESGEVVPADLCDELATQLEGQSQEVKDQIIAQFGADCPNLGQ